MRIVFPLPEAFWLAVARAAPEATFFHSPLWHRLIAATWPSYRDVSVGVEMPGGGRAVLPLLELGRRVKGIFREMESTFGGCYGGLITDIPLDEDARSRAFRAALKAHRLARLHLTGNPLAPDPSLENGERREDATHILPLHGAEPIEHRFSKGHRCCLRAAARAGVTVTEATTLEDYRAYYEIYQDSLARWGERTTSQYPFALFENGWRLSQEQPGHITLWLARHEERVVAGAWVFVWNRHAVYWHGATRSDTMRLSGGHMLQTEIARDAIRRGLEWYDFNPSGGHEGVALFKRGFGAERRRIARHVITGRLFAGAMALRGARG